MFRKLLIGVVASLSLLSPLALPTTSEAHERYEHHYRFAVYYRDCAREPWRFGGSYFNREEAFRVAHRYRERGFEAYVR